jgi:hypothetical protein
MCYPIIELNFRIGMDVFDYIEKEYSVIPDILTCLIKALLKDKLLLFRFYALSLAPCALSLRPTPYAVSFIPRMDNTLRF